MKKMSKLKTSKEAKEYIKGLRELLEERGLNDSLDELALQLIEVAYHKYIEATKVLLEEGSTYTYTNGNGETIYRDRPEVKQAKDSHIQLVKLLQEFGLSPSSRKRVKDAVKQVEEKDPLHQLLGTREVR